MQEKIGRIKLEYSKILNATRIIINKRFGAEMELITKDLLINFLFILLPLFLLQMVYSLKFVYRIDKVKNILFTLLFMVSIGLCMLFPFSLGDGLTWDLRRIPFIIGILYGGPQKRSHLINFSSCGTFFHRWRFRFLHNCYYL